jgi:hypothetical protein
VAAFGADVLWLLGGLLLVWRGWPRALAAVFLGLLLQAQIVVNHLLDARVALADIDASGLPRALELALPAGGWFTTGLAAWPDEQRDLLLGSGLVALAYLGAGALLAPWVVGHWWRWRSRLARPAAPGQRRWGPLLACGGLAIATACSPIGSVGQAESNWHGLTEAAAPTTSPRARRHTTERVDRARRVAVEPTPTGWRYLVDGTPTVIHGVGYNPQYAGLPAADRQAHYDRDFAQMRDLGINTVEGWFEPQFDRLTLDSAARHDVGVIMPFELNQDWDYTDPTVRDGILQRVSTYIERYRFHPAVRMWSPGNENLHRILFAGWVSRANDPQAQARAAAFAAFLPQLVDRIHALDPQHPVLYRDAEDRYVEQLRAAFDAAPADRPWLIYGTNVYTTPRLQAIVDAWPAQWPGRPLVVSEFAPSGMGRSDRAAGYARQWDMIALRSDTVLGGLAYVWATNGPEELDRVFGLVDDQGNETDGSLSTLGALYRAGDT